MATVTPTEHPSPLDAPHGTEIAVLVILVAWTAFSHRGASDPHVTTQGAAASSAH